MRGVRGRIDGTEPQVAVVSRRHRRHYAGVRRCVDRRVDQIPRRLDLGLAERDVEHVHAVADGGLDCGGELRRVGVEADLARDRRSPVVAEVRARGDARQTNARPRRGAVVPGSDARHVQAVVGLVRVERQRRARVRVRPGGECARDDHLGSRVRGLSLREPGRIGVAGRIEEGVGLVDPVVDDPDLHSLSRSCERGPPDGRCSDQLRRAVEQIVVRDGGPDLCDAGDAYQPVDVAAWHHDREAVQHDAVVPPGARARNRCADARLDGTLGAGEGGEVGPAGGRAQQESPRLGKGRECERALV